MDEARAFPTTIAASRLQEIARELDLIAQGGSSFLLAQPDSTDPILIAEPQTGEANRPQTEEARRQRPAPVELSREAREIYRKRRLRGAMIADQALFGEPAWDILLDLFAADGERRRLSVTDACIGSGVPSTTALRWIAILETKGLLARENDPRDARRVWLHLTDDGRAKMTRYLSAIRAG